MRHSPPLLSLLALLLPGAPALAHPAGFIATKLPAKIAKGPDIGRFEIFKEPRGGSCTSFLKSSMDPGSTTIVGSHEAGSYGNTACQPHVGFDQKRAGSQAMRVFRRSGQACVAISPKGAFATADISAVVLDWDNPQRRQNPACDKYFDGIWTHARDHEWLHMKDCLAVIQEANAKFAREKKLFEECSSSSQPDTQAMANRIMGRVQGLLQPTGAWIQTEIRRRSDALHRRIGANTPPMDCSTCGN